MNTLINDSKTIMYEGEFNFSGGDFLYPMKSRRFNLEVVYY